MKFQPFYTLTMCKECNNYCDITAFTNTTAYGFCDYCHEEVEIKIRNVPSNLDGSGLVIGYTGL